MRKTILDFLTWYSSRAPRFLAKRLEDAVADKDGGYMWSRRIREIYRKRYKIEIGYGSYGGCFLTGNLAPGVVFGNYCSVAPSIRIFRGNHPKDAFTTHPILYNPTLGYVKKDMLVRPVLEIGHDVWIGEWAVILPSVRKIGNGAIIGAGAIVTKDVPPYSIVAGNPAKPIGRRFSQEIIDDLESSRWWEMERDELVQNADHLTSLINFSQFKTA
jgi:virginiamycin A acetyltransferase